jgi:hypothetical protein
LKLFSVRDRGELANCKVIGLYANSAAPISSQSPPSGSSIFTPTVEALAAFGAQLHRAALLFFWIP